MPASDASLRARVPARAGPVPTWIGRVLEPVYRAAVTRRNARFDRGEGVRRFSIPVISVGNLSVGGTGKTPTVVRLVGLLQESGFRPSVVMRGYKRPRGDGAMSDEQAEYVEAFGGRVPVLADPDRCRSIGALEADRRADVVVMDDGFQHRRVHRDLDIVLLDATRDVFTDHLLPLGWLREPVGSLARAHAVVLSHADAVTPEAREASRRRVLELCPRALWCESEHGWDSITLHRPGSDAASAAPVEWLKGRTFVLACAIGNPGAFERQLSASAARVAERFVRADHHAWTVFDLNRIAHAVRRCGAEGVLTTMKDWVKFRTLKGAGELCWGVPRLSIRITSGERELGEAVRAAARPAR